MVELVPDVGKLPGISQFAMCQKVLLSNQAEPVKAHFHTSDVGDWQCEISTHHHLYKSRVGNEP